MTKASWAGSQITVTMVPPADPDAAPTAIPGAMAEAMGVRWEMPSPGR